MDIPLRNNFREPTFLAGCEQLLGIELSKDLHYFCDESSPAGLVAGTQAGTVVPMKVFIKQNVIPPVGIGLEFLRPAIDRASSGGIAHKGCRQSPRDLLRYLEQVHHLTRSRGTLHFEVV